MKTILLVIVLALGAFGEASIPSKALSEVSFSKSQILTRISELEAMRDDLVGRINSVNGAIADYRYMLQQAEKPKEKSDAKP